MKLKLTQLLQRVFSYLDNNHKEEIYFPQFLMGVLIYYCGENWERKGEEQRIGRLGVCLK